MNIEYSPLALRDLDRIWGEVFESSGSTEIAEKYISDLMDQIRNKREFPKSGSPLYYEDIFTGYYFIVFKAYMAFYQVDSSRILITRIVYRKSDYMRIIFRHPIP